MLNYELVLNPAKNACALSWCLPLSQEDPRDILGTILSSSISDTALFKLQCISLIHVPRVGIVQEELFTPLMAKFPGSSRYAMMVRQDCVLNIVYLLFSFL